jgi:Zn-dependent protease
MNSEVLLQICSQGSIGFAIFFLPLSILFHELGHIAAARFFFAPVDSLYIMCKEETHLCSFSVRDVQVYLGFNIFSGGRVHIAASHLPKIEKALIYFAGPLVNILLATLLIQHDISTVAAVSEVLTALINLTPFIPGSDGNQILKTFLGGRSTRPRF